MSHTTHNLPQGSSDWHAHRAGYFNASEAAAMLGISSYQSRTELLHAKATGLPAEVDAATQRRFDAGHHFEALARPWAEELIGEELFPITASRVIDGLKLSASYDGATLMEDVAFEHKSLNAVLVENLSVGIIPEQYHPQLEQQLLIIGATRTLFMASSGSKETMLSAWYESNPELRARLLAAWKQFAADLAAYTPPVAVIEAIGHTPETLPALRIEVTGMVTASNLADYKAHALAVFGGINRELTTDQQFADAEKVVKWCGDVEDRLAAAKQHALSQTASIDELFRAIDDISAEARRTRLELDKLVKARKEAVRGEIVAEGVKALAEHIAGLNARLGKNYMPAVSADFGGAIKGKRTVDSLRDAVSTTLANAKIDASATADKIQTNLTTLRELAANHAFLFSDTAQIVQKAPDDLTMLVKSRIAEHQVAEAAKEEATRECIRAEEKAKAQREAQAEADRLDEQQASQRLKEYLDASKPALPAEAEAEAHIERNGPDSHGSTFPGHPAAGFDVPPGYQRIWSAPEAGASGVVSIPSSGEDQQDDGARINLGAINEHLAPIKLDAAGLEQLGFVPVAIVKASKQYRACDLPAIRRALTEHLSQLSELQAA